MLFRSRTQNTAVCVQFTQFLVSRRVRVPLCWPNQIQEKKIVFETYRMIFIVITKMGIPPAQKKRFLEVVGALTFYLVSV